MPARARAAASGPVVLGAKLHVPPARTGRIARPVLLERLAVESLPRVTLVAAPPGFGKTTLLAAWCAAAPETAFAWVSLDRADNDPVRFWTYVVEACRRVAPGVGLQALPLLRAPGTHAIDAFLPALVNELEEQRAASVLVVDDYHLIANEEIHESFGYLIEHLPDTVHLVVATRADPPLPLPRVRAQGELLEIRAADLRFSRDETAAFLNDVLGLGLEPADVEVLHERTEGWAAGLYLAALSLAEHEDAHRFIDEFAGDDRHIVDYLLAEVLDRQPREVRTFLLRTSILERLSADLCDAVLERRDSAGTLRGLERSNLFLIPLDTRRGWYRYHHLFADLLRSELQRTEPESVPGLHRRASDWLRDHGSVSEAVAHALAAADLVEASDLIAVHWNDYMNQGRLRTVTDWLDALPEETVRTDPRLCLARAGTSLTLGRRDDVDHWIDAAERATVDEDRPRRGASSVRAEAAIYRAAHRYMVGDFAAASAAGLLAVDLEPDEGSPWRAMALGALGRTLFWLGDARRAHELLEHAVALAQPGSNTISVVGALGYLAVIRAGEGGDHQAQELVDRALAMIDEHGFREHWVGAMTLVARSTLLARRRELAQAEQDAGRAVELTRRGNLRPELAYALLGLADIRHARREVAGARMAVSEARSIVDALPEPGVLSELVARHERLAAARPRGSGGPALGDELTLQELAVLRLLPTERSLREVAAALYISYNTVKTHVRAIYRKLDASSRQEAVERARELDLV